jgi:hypothetical protein
MDPSGRVGSAPVQESDRRRIEPLQGTDFAAHFSCSGLASCAAAAVPSQLAAAGPDPGTGTVTRDRDARAG